MVGSKLAGAWQAGKQNKKATVVRAEMGCRVRGWGGGFGPRHRPASRRKVDLCSAILFWC